MHAGPQDQSPQPAKPPPPPAPAARSRRAIEREFGVPIPGRILEESHWTRTALKKVPPGILDFAALFGRDGPVVLDLGCGNGRFTLASALSRPGHNHLAVDILPLVIRYATRRANQRGLGNVRFAVIGGRELLASQVAPAAIAEIHCYHPQPYCRPGEFHKRLITPQFLALAHRSLVPGGLLVVQTDNAPYWGYMRQVVPAFFEFEEHPGRWPDAPQGRTRREIIALRKGLRVFRAVCRARVDLPDPIELAQSLPLPTFSAGRQHRELDRLERGG